METFETLTRNIFSSFNVLLSRPFLPVQIIVALSPVKMAGRALFVLDCLDVFVNIPTMEICAKVRDKSSSRKSINCLNFAMHTKTRPGQRRIQVHGQGGC